MKIYIGTYATHIYEADFVGGQLSKPIPKAETENPSYLCLSADGKGLYTVVEVHSYRGKPGGGVRAYSLPDYTLLGEANTDYNAPCFLTLSPTGERLYVANYTGGALSVYKITDKGLDTLLICPYEGHSVNEERQEWAHAHQALFTSDKEYFCVPDLGTDSVYIYRETADGIEETDKLTLPAGAGPRHMVFSEDGKYAYLCTELSSEVYVYRYAAGRFTLLQSIHALPDEVVYPQSAAAAIRVKGDFVYLSNRGRDSIAVFAQDANTGLLTLQKEISTQGKIPRDFIFVKESGKEYLLVANQDSHDIAVFAVLEDGADLKHLYSVPVRRPACLLATDTE